MLKPFFSNTAEASGVLRKAWKALVDELAFFSSAMPWRIGLYSEGLTGACVDLGGDVRRKQQRLGDKAHFGGTCRDVLRGLANVLALHKQGLHLVPKAGLLQRFAGGFAIWGQFRVGDGNVLDRAVGQRLLKAGKISVDLHGAACRCDHGETAINQCGGCAIGLPVLFEARDAGFVGGEEQLERCALFDLAHEVAGGAVADLDLAAVRLFK